MELFARNIKYLRKQHSLTQPQIKDKLDIEPTTWSGYERGKSYPNLRLFHLICEYFQVSETDLLNSDLEKTPKIHAGGNRTTGSSMGEQKLKYGSREDADDSLKIQLNYCRDLLKAKEQVVEVLKENLALKDEKIATLASENDELKQRIAAIKAKKGF